MKIKIMPDNTMDLEGTPKELYEFSKLLDATQDQREEQNDYIVRIDSESTRRYWKDYLNRKNDRS